MKTMRENKMLFNYRINMDNKTFLFLEKNIALKKKYEK